jgi:hypothetical protein
MPFDTQHRAMSTAEPLPRAHRSPYRLIGSYEDELIELAKTGRNDPETVERMRAIQRKIETREATVIKSFNRDFGSDGPDRDEAIENVEADEDDMPEYRVSDEEDEETGHCSVERVLRLNGFGANEASEIEALLRPTMANQAMALAVGLTTRIMDTVRGTPAGEGIRRALGLSITGDSLRKTALQIGVSVQRLSLITKTFAAKFPELKQRHNGREKNWMGRSKPPDTLHDWLPTGPAALRVGVSTNVMGGIYRAGLVQGVKGGSRVTWFKVADLDALIRQHALTGLCWRDFLKTGGKGAPAEAKGHPPG